MIGRNAVLFAHAPQTLAIVAVVGAATAFFAGTIGLVQNDIKRVLAYSTVSQLGYMFLAMGVGAFTAGIFHLYTHAFFKALLFLGSGAVIHALNGRAGSPRDGRPQEAAADHLLDVSHRRARDCGRSRSRRILQQGRDPLSHLCERTHSAVAASALLTSLLTAIYMFRLVFLAFHGDAGTLRLRPPRHTVRTTPGMAHATHLHDAPPAMAFALIVLAVGSVAAGYINVPHAIGGSDGASSASSSPASGLASI